MIKIRWKATINFLAAAISTLSVISCQVPANPEIIIDSPTATSTEATAIITEESPTSTPSSKVQFTWWIDPKIPQVFRDKLTFLSTPEIIENSESAQFLIRESSSNKNQGFTALTHLLVISAPFSRYETSLNLNTMVGLIVNRVAKDNLVKIWINENDLEILYRLYPQLNREGLLVNQSYPDFCDEITCYRIHSFEESLPTWRILEIGGNHPLHSDFQIEEYPLAYHLIYEAGKLDSLTKPEEVDIIPVSNYIVDDMTSLLMSGTTALVRNTALQMEEYGVLFPLDNLEDLLNSTDLTHISNEVPFYSLCPPARPLRKEMRFCSSPGYIDLLKQAGVDIIELTGNHLLDWGPVAFEETLDLYELNHFEYFGGGRDASIAEQPLLISHNGNQLAFIGCNVAGPSNDWATADRPGALKCDPDRMVQLIQEVEEKGYLPIVTVQHYEIEDFRPLTQVKNDFWRYGEAGAVIVSGSQAHFPQGFDFINSSFVHYGLGNLFFDQMTGWLRKSTLDIHYFYQGRYINTEILGLVNENYGQPRLMTPEESRAYFDRLFIESFYYQGESR